MAVPRLLCVGLTPCFLYFMIILALLRRKSAPLPCLHVRNGTINGRTMQEEKVQNNTNNHEVPVV